jgi:nucleoid-associated protein YgaU
VLVRPGDSLWSLATRDLPAGSPAPLVAERWHAIYAANRSLIGPDPDVLVPGQRLRLPGKDPS